MTNISISDAIKILEEVDFRGIATDAEARRMFAEIVKRGDDEDKEKKEAILSEALIILHSLPCLQAVHTPQEIATANVHRIMKRCVKSLFIDFHFRDVKFMPTATLKEIFASLFGAFADSMTGELLHAFRASGRRLVSSKRPRGSRPKTKRTPQPMSVTIDPIFDDVVFEADEQQARDEPIKIL